MTDSASPEAAPRKIPMSGLAALGAVALAIRVYRLDHFSYWLDEIMQSFFIHGTWKQFWGSVRFDAVHPPLDYLVDRLVEILRPSEAARRLPAVVWGTGSVLLLAILVARRAGRVVGTLAGSLLALAPFHVRYSQEFRPYSLGVFSMLMALVLLDRYLEQPSSIRITALYFACLAAMYALYLGALVLAIAGAALILEDAISSHVPFRRASARRFLPWAPVFASLLVVGYLPWLPVVRDAARSAPTRSPAPNLARFDRLLGFYGFGSREGAPPGLGEFVYYFLVAVGIAVALKRRGMRFLTIWIVAGSAAVELLEHLHPHFFAPRHFLPVGVALPAAAALGIAAIGRKNLSRLGASAALAIAITAFDVHGLAEYFRNGRPDWRPLGAYLRDTPSDERIITETAYSGFCVAYYVAGPGWLHRPLPGGKESGRSIVSLDRDPAPISWLWEPGKTAWLVVTGDRPSSVKRWAEPYSGIAFPTAEGGAIVKRLAPRR